MKKLSKKVKIGILGLILPVFSGAYFFFLNNNKEENLPKINIKSNEDFNRDNIVVGPDCSEITDEAEYIYAGCNGFY